jgi:hypothetical protein
MYQHTRNEFEHFRAPAEIEGDGDYVLKRERLVSRSSAAETSSIPGDYCCTWTNIAACQQQSHPGEAHMRISDPHRVAQCVFSPDIFRIAVCLLIISAVVPALNRQGMQEHQPGGAQRAQISRRSLKVNLRVY